MSITRYSNLFKNIAFFVTVLMFALLTGVILTYAEGDGIEKTEVVIIQETPETPPAVVQEAIVEVPSPLVEVLEIPVSENVAELEDTTVLSEPLFLSVPSPAEPLIQQEIVSQNSVVEAPGSITILLDAIPNNGQNFLYSNNFDNGNPVTFELDDDSTVALPKTRTFEVLPGTYTVSQDIAGGWKFINVICSDGSLSSAIEVASGENITCTFTNKKLGTITLVKHTEGGDGIFNFDTTGTSLPAHIELATENGSTSVTFTDIDPESMYSITEVQKDGWELTDATCTRGTPENFNLIATNLNVTCTFQNTYTAVPGEIRLIKETYPDGALDEFQFVGDIENPTSDGGDILAAEVMPGTYTTSELPVEGWTISNIVCDDTDSGGEISTGIVSYEVSSGEVVTCTVTNVKDPSIEIDGSGVTPVGEEHTFTVILGQNTKDMFTPVADGTKAEISITPAGYTLIEDTCTTVGTVGGICTMTINSDIPGIFTAHGKTTLAIDGITYNLETDGQGENTLDITKTYIDANIAINPQTATNNVGEEHTVTASVLKNNGAGFVGAEGETVMFMLVTNTAGATFTSGVNTCITDVAGTCSVAINAASPGVVVIHAASSVLVEGFEIERATDGTQGSSFDAEKIYQGGKIIIQKITEGGSADFMFAASYNLNGFSLGNGESNDSGYLPLGTYRVNEIIPQGWQQESATCDNGDSPAQITIRTAGETVVCTFVNRKIGSASMLTIVKDTKPDNGKDFMFIATGTISSKFILDDDAKNGHAKTKYNNTKIFTGIPTGTVTISELLSHTPWIQSAVACTNDSDGTTFLTTAVKNGVLLQLTGGEAVTCIFTNMKSHHKHKKYGRDGQRDED